ncbi:MAG: calcium/sodium antiporter [Oscillospiraceae bacterium]|nr:calcium/sodium antiporter [Candidatus Equicaccousia limihippi]
MWIECLLFAVGLVLLIKGGDFFVDGAVGIAKRFRLPEVLIGATVVSIGTTLPEVMVSTQAAALNNGSIAYGNAIGSIICNTTLIAALTIAVTAPTVDKNAFRIPTVFFFIAMAIYCFNAYVFKDFSRISGIILLALFLVYIIISAKTAIRDNKLAAQNTNENTETAEETDENGKKSSLAKDIILLVAGALFIAVGARLLIDNGTVIAKWLGVPDSVIALTFVALGTSLPELVTAITALVKKHGALSIGNIVGANLFNLVLVSGLAVTVSPFKLPADKMLFGLNSSLVVDLPLAGIVMLGFTLPACFKGKIPRWIGIAFLVIYLAFCVYQFAF